MVFVWSMVFVMHGRGLSATKEAMCKVRVKIFGAGILSDLF